MAKLQKLNVRMVMIWVGLFIVVGCAGSPRTLDPSISGTQLVVNPESIRLSVSKLKETNIVFEGSGLNPVTLALIAEEKSIASRRIYVPIKFRRKTVGGVDAHFSCLGKDGR